MVAQQYTRNNRSWCNGTNIGDASEDLKSQSWNFLIPLIWGTGVLGELLTLSVMLE